MHSGDGLDAGKCRPSNDGFGTDIKLFPPSSSRRDEDGAYARVLLAALCLKNVTEIKTSNTVTKR